MKETIEVHCPKCKRAISWEGNPHRPFCSELCKQRDLGSWAMEKYRIPCAHDDSSKPTEESPEKGIGEGSKGSKK